MNVETKYGSLINFEPFRERTGKDILKILSLKDANKDWDKYLSGFLVRLNGMDALFESLDFQMLIANLEGLFSLQLDEKVRFRKVVLDSVDLLKKIKIEKVG